jgi:hypothetical protein
MICTVKDALAVLESTKAESVSGYDPWFEIVAPET